MGKKATTLKKGPRSAGKAEQDMGHRIRLRRAEIGLSQEELGRALGVSFQQVQKYEKGANRVGASRLEKIAEVLQVPVDFFFSGGQSKAQSEVDSLLFVDSKFSLRLLRAYVAIKDVDLRRQFVALMEKVAGTTEPF